MQTSLITKRLEWALSASTRAADFILKYYQAADLAVESKSDASPVTIADRGAEELLRDEIADLFPDDAILGEEFGIKAGTSGFQWILDPIDGTKSFVHGTPLFGTLIGLTFQEECVAGLCRFPALDEVVYAQRGGGTFWQRGTQAPRRCTVRKTAALEDATFCYTAVDGWQEVGRFDQFEQLCRQTRLARGWGDCYGHMLVATGRADVMIDPLLNAWDAAALVPIVSEAGGVFVDFSGKATIHGGNGISVVPSLQAAVLGQLT